MEYVMVPVPEHLRADVEHFLTWNVDRRSVEWDIDAATSYLEGLDSRARELVVAAADAAYEARILTCAEVCRRFGCPELEVWGLALETNERARRAGGPLIVVIPNLVDDEEQPEGSRQVVMPVEVAKVLLHASGRGLPEDV